MEFACPSCKSDNIQRLCAVYEGGLSAINTTSSGSAIGITRGGIGVGVGSSRTKGTSQTAASVRAAPPARKTYLKPIGIIFFIFFIIFILTGDSNRFVSGALNLGFYVAAAGWIYFAYQYNSKTWPPLKEQWDNSYLCCRCNEVFCMPSFSANQQVIGSQA